jgi:hypothetical protein
LRFAVVVTISSPIYSEESSDRVRLCDGFSTLSCYDKAGRVVDFSVATAPERRALQRGEEACIATRISRLEPAVIAYCDDHNESILLADRFEALAYENYLMRVDCVLASKGIDQPYPFLPKACNDIVPAYRRLFAEHNKGVPRDAKVVACVENELLEVGSSFTRQCDDGSLSLGVAYLRMARALTDRCSVPTDADETITD